MRLSVGAAESKSVFENRGPFFGSSSGSPGEALSAEKLPALSRPIGAVFWGSGSVEAAMGIRGGYIPIISLQEV
jgi:hypothetical protein